jgi:hypothetical protein
MPRCASLDFYLDRKYTIPQVSVFGKNPSPRVLRDVGSFKVTERTATAHTSWLCLTHCIFIRVLRATKLDPYDLLLPPPGPLSSSAIR